MNSYTDSSSKRYVCSIISFVLLFLGSGEWIVRSFIIPIPNTTPHQIYFIYTSKSRNVAIGDSHIYRTFIANEKFLNLGQGGTTIPTMKIIVEQYFKYREPGRVIVEASPQLLSEDYLTRGSQGYEQYFNQNYPFLLRFYLFEPGIGSWIKGIKSLKDFSRLTTDRKEGEKDMTITGDWNTTSFETRKSRTGNRIRHQEPKINAAQEDIIKYEELIKVLVARGADVCMFRTPIDETYLKLIEDNSSFKKSVEIFKKISSENGVRYVDFQDLNYNFSLDKFINQDHVTPKTSAEIAPLIHDSCFEE